MKSNGPSASGRRARKPPSRSGDAYAVCIVGNSHIAALKDAWTNRPPATAPGLSLTFFSAPTNLMERLTVRDRALVAPGSLLEGKLAQTSGGKNSIEADAYDAFVMVGNGFGVDVPKLCEGLGIAEHLEWGPVENLVSHACFGASARAMLEGCTAIVLADMLRTIFDGPMLMQAAPFRPQKVLDTPEYRDDRRLGDRRALEIIVARTVAAASEICAGRNMELFWQDQSTIGLPGFTREEFWKLPSERDVKLGREDMRHMNEDYGLMTLCALFRRLDELSHGRVLASGASKTSPNPASMSGRRAAGAILNREHCAD